MGELLQISGLTVRFYTYDGVVQAVEDMNLDIGQGETFGLVGETGCGKTMTALSILVLPPPLARIEKGSIRLDFGGGQEPVDILTQNQGELRAMRGRRVSMIFQEPGGALNPVFTISDQISEVLLLHRQQDLSRRALKAVERSLARDGTSMGALARPLFSAEKLLYQEMVRKPRSLTLRLLSRAPLARRLLWRLKDEANKMSIDLLKGVGISDPERVARRYPHELSGGMKQRVVIAMALACSPQLLIADEPTTSLDVTVQAQILELLRRSKIERALSLLYITHNFGVVAEICDRVGVMYAGSMCEVAPVGELFNNPLHPYTKMLMEAVPRPGAELMSIGGTVPDPINPPSGCRFHPRCPRVTAICRQQTPRMTEVTPEHRVACHLY